jgi:hypothetical protein
MTLFCGLSLAGLNAQAGLADSNSTQWLAEMVSQPGIKLGQRWNAEKWADSHQLDPNELGLPQAKTALWKAAEGKNLPTWARVSPDGAWAASVQWKKGKKAEIRVWDIAEKRLVASFNGKSEEQLKTWLEAQSINWMEDAEWAAWAEEASWNQGLMKTWSAQLNWAQ